MTFGACRPSVALAAACAALVLAACGTDTVTGSPPALEPDLSAYTISVGDCLNDGNASTAVVPEVVECAAPHDNEAYLSVRLEEGPFPGAEAITATAITDCATEFGTFTGISHEASIQLDFSWYYPSEETWAIGDREILCLVHELNEERTPVKSTGSLEGANR